MEMELMSMELMGTLRTLIGDILGLIAGIIAIKTWQSEGARFSRGTKVLLVIIFVIVNGTCAQFTGTIGPVVAMVLILALSLSRNRRGSWVLAGFYGLLAASAMVALVVNVGLAVYANKDYWKLIWLIAIPIFLLLNRAPVARAERGEIPDYDEELDDDDDDDGEGLGYHLSRLMGLAILAAIVCGVGILVFK